MKKYKVTILSFSDKVYQVDNIQDILNEVKIFTDIENIVNIEQVFTIWQYVVCVWHNDTLSYIYDNLSHTKQINTYRE